MIPSPEVLNELSRNTLAERLGIHFTASGPDWIEAEMPVDDRTRQPYGILHGGASAALAETLGSIGSHYLSVPNKIAGLEINANHIRSISEGKVIGRAQLLHGGRTTHLWEIKISDEKGRLVCISRLTVIVLKEK